MEQEATGYATAGGMVKLPVLPCPVCGLIEVPVVGPGRGPHVAELRCQAGHHIKWAPKALLGLKEERAVGCINRVILCGTISKYGITLKYATSGTACASFALELREEDRDGKVHTLWQDCEVWGRRAERISELDSGQLVLFEGKLSKRKRGETWETVVSGFDLTPVLAPQASLTGSAN